MGTRRPEGCPPYRDKIYDPFWARAEEMELPITLHIVTGRIPDPMACHTVREWEEGPNMFLDTWEEIPHVLATDFTRCFPRLDVAARISFSGQSSIAFRGSTS